MAASVVVGAQFGSEGKGKMVAYLSLTKSPHAVVRCGGPNAGHGYTTDGRRVCLRQLPAGVVSRTAHLMIAPGAVVDEELLLREAEEHGALDRIIIDQNATLVQPEDMWFEHAASMKTRLGSTLSGTASATAKRVLRSPNTRRVCDSERLAEFAGDVSARVNSLLDRRLHVVIEGTQGFGLSLYHGGYYPHATSRDTTAAAFLSEVGISPLMVTDIVMVVRTFPIRVSGQGAGPLPNETSWEAVRKSSGSSHKLLETTSVSKQTRRVAQFDPSVVRRAATINRPTSLAVHGADYLDSRDRGVRDFDRLSRRTRQFILELEEMVDTPVSYVFTGPELLDVCER